MPTQRVAGRGELHGRKSEALVEAEEMFALRIQLPYEEMHAAVGDEAYQSTLHVDREVQVDLCELPADDAEVAAAVCCAVGGAC